MAEILKDTEQRLVVALGVRGRRWSKFIFDKGLGRAWFERHHPHLPARTFEAALDEVAAIDAVPARGTPDIVVTLKSGKHLLLTGEASTETVLSRIRSFIGIAETSTAGGIDFARRHRRRIALGIAATGALAVLIVGIISIIDLFVLPGCDARWTRNQLHTLLQSNVKSPIRLADFGLVSRERDELRCQARLTVEGHDAIVGYRSDWDGWTPRVRVAGTVGTARLDPARLRAIDGAYDAFMMQAREAYRSGNPPRQFDTKVYALLSTVFDVGDLSSRTLAGADIDEAIRWFNSGDTVGSVYVLAGTGVTDFAGLPADAAVQRQLRTNVVSFSDEYGRYIDFQVMLLAAIAAAQASHTATGPRAEVESADFKAKVAGIKPLLAQALKSDFISMVYEGLSDTWRLDRLTALARVAPLAARVLSRDDAASVREQALQTLPYFASDTVKARAREVAGMIAPR
jgi:hypothetical protein